MKKSPKNVERVVKRGRPSDPPDQRKIKTSIYLPPDMAQFIADRIEEGEAYNYSSFVYLCVKKYIKSYKESKLD